MWLNLALLEQHFGLPIFKHTLRALLPVYSQCHMDVGGIFYTSSSTLIWDHLQEYTQLTSRIGQTKRDGKRIGLEFGNVGIRI